MATPPSTHHLPGQEEGDRGIAAATGAMGILGSMAGAVAILAMVEALTLQLGENAVMLGGIDRLLLALALIGPQALLSVGLVVIEFGVLLVLLRLRPKELVAARQRWRQASPATLGWLTGLTVFVGLSWLKEHRFEQQFIKKAYDAPDHVAIIMASLNVALTVGVMLIGVACAAAVRRVAEKVSATTRRRWQYASVVTTCAAVATAEFLLLTREAPFLPSYAREIGGALLILTTQGVVALAWPFEVKPTRRTSIIILTACALCLGSLRFASAPFFNLRRTLIERAGHAGATFGVLRNLVDFDRDGVTSWLGGADCDDLSEDIHPLAMDAPDDGIDQNCTGADATLRPGVGAVALATTPVLPEHAPWNVLWIVIDTLRFDRVGRKIAGRSITPHLDRLAESATVFDNARSTSAHTMESFPSMLSGRFPTYLVRRGKHIDPHAMLASQLANNGYVTGFATPVHTMPPILKAGFMRFEDQFSRGQDFLNTVTARPITNTTIAWMKSRESPFFFVVHYFDPHAAFLRHADFDYGDSPEQRYDSEVAFTDHHVGKLLNHVKKTGLRDRTVIVVTADHGEGFGEHGRSGHGRLPYEEVLRVPLLISVPGVPPRVVSAPVSLIDLMPTMLHLTSVPDPGHLQGSSLVPLIMGEDDGRSVTYHEVNTTEVSWRAAIKGNFKYVLGLKNNIELLFDLSVDPNELHNIAGSNPRRTEMRALLDAFRDDWLDAAPFAEPLRRQPAP